MKPISGSFDEGIELGAICTNDRVWLPDADENRSTLCVRKTRNYTGEAVRRRYIGLELKSRTFSLLEQARKVRCADHSGGNKDQVNRPTADRQAEGTYRRVRLKAWRKARSLFSSFVDWCITVNT